MIGVGGKVRCAFWFVIGLTVTAPEYAKQLANGSVYFT